MVDVIIIGGGVVGCATARELSKYDLNILVIEKEEDVSCGASKANSGIVHAGYDCEVGTLKAELNVAGAKMYKTLSKTLDFPYVNNGSLIISLDDTGQAGLQSLYDKGIKNGVEGLRMLTGDEARALEPNLSKEVKGALLAESAGIVSPYEATVAFAENAYDNGANFLFNTKVINIKQDPKGYTVITDNGTFKTKAVVNAAGIYSDQIHNFVCPTQEEVYPQRGEYYLMDNVHQGFVQRTIFQLPTNLGKGILVTTTTHGNIMIGPNAEVLEDKTDKATTIAGLKEVLNKAQLSASDVPAYDKITIFSGLRAKHHSTDFVIDEPLKGFVDGIGIDSPGLSAAPAIGVKIAKMITEYLQPKEKENFINERKGIRRFKEQEISEQSNMIKENPAYGNIICRCETVTEGEIVDAIHRSLGARSLDGLKRRTRAQMGRCQGGFCTMRLIEILSRELDIPVTQVTKSGKNSTVLQSHIKESL